MTFQFSARVSLTLSEVRMVRGEEALLLIGTDLLTPRIHTWGFWNVGYEARTGRGVISFTYKMGEDSETIELVQAPGALLRAGEEWGAMVGEARGGASAGEFVGASVAASGRGGKRSKARKSVVADPAPTPEGWGGKHPCLGGARMRALLSRGQCL